MELFLYNFKVNLICCKAAKKQRGAALALVSAPGAGGMKKVHPHRATGAVKWQNSGQISGNKVDLELWAFALWDFSSPARMQ